MSSIRFAVIVVLLGTAAGAYAQMPFTLKGADGVELVFEQRDGRYFWTQYRDTLSGKKYVLSGPDASLETMEDLKAQIDGYDRLIIGGQQRQARIVLETKIPSPRIDVRRTFNFCDDGRTVRVHTMLRAPGAPAILRRIDLLEARVTGERFHLNGADWVSCPIFGDNVFAGVEHPVAHCQAEGDAFRLAQHPYMEVGKEWVETTTAVFGSASAADTATAGGEALRRAFIRYLETVRVQPKDLHIHYNDWWTAPAPSSESFVLSNIEALQAGLKDAPREEYPRTFVFDSYAMDMGWSDPKSVWQIDTKQFPQGFTRVRDALAELGSRPGMWISPSSLYPPALDNKWLQEQGYETFPGGNFGPMACLGIGGKYQQAFKEAALTYQRDAHLAHMKFDGYRGECNEPNHGHPAGPESAYFLAEGLRDVFDSLRAQDPDIALEPTCFGYKCSPWWLMHVPFIIGPFGDDSPYGRVPCPEYIESMTTAREIENLQGRDSFLMPSNALQCFDIIKQCPGAFQNHAVMTLGRGRWFWSCYINPKYMDPEAWRFFSKLIAWGRAHRESLIEPLPIGGNPEKREAYGYAFLAPDRQLYCLRNPWIESAAIALKPFPGQGRFEVRRLYPRRDVLGRMPAGSEPAQITLGPYETQIVEVAPTEAMEMTAPSRPAPEGEWKPDATPRLERIVYAEEPAPFGPSWTSLDGDRKDALVVKAAGTLRVEKVLSAEFCVLLEGDAAIADSRASITIDGQSAPITVSTSEGGFGASGKGLVEHWVWYIASAPAGEHKLAVEIETTGAPTSFAVFARGDVTAPAMPQPFEPGPAFPTWREDRLSWSQTLVPALPCVKDDIPTVARTRTIERIDGVYLDAIPWREASSGWGEASQRASVMDKPLTIGGKHYWRGIGTHAVSKIVYDLPDTFRVFTATIGCDQEVSNGSVIFVVEGDGKELYRSPRMTQSDASIPIETPIDGVRVLTLRVEDAGDSVGADHADWADARVLK